MKLSRPSPLVFIFLTVFIEFMGSSLLVPILPYIVEHYRTDGATIGFLGASFSLAQFFSSPVLGAVSDRYGRRPVLLGCMVASAVGYLVCGLAGSLVMLFVGRIFGGLAAGVISAAQAYVADISTPADRTKNFGLIGAAFGLGFITGPAIGGFLAQFSLQLPLFAAAVLSLANALLGYFSLTESLKTPRTGKLTLQGLNPLRQLGDLLQDDRFRALILSLALFNFAFAGFQNNFAVYTHRQFGWNPQQNALLFAYIGVISSLVQGGLIRVLLPRWGEQKLAVIGLTLCGCSIMGVGLVTSSNWLFFTQALTPLGVGLAIPSLRGLLSAQATDDEQGRVIGGSNGLTSLAMVLGPLWTGLAFDHIGHTAPYWSTGLCVLLAMGLTVSTAKDRASRATA